MCTCPHLSTQVFVTFTRLPFQANAADNTGILVAFELQQREHHFTSLPFDLTRIFSAALCIVLLFCFGIWCCHTKWSTTHMLCIHIIHNSENATCYFIWSIQSGSDAMVRGCECVWWCALFCSSFILNYITTGTRNTVPYLWPIAIIAKKCYFHWNNIVLGWNCRSPFHETPGGGPTDAHRWTDAHFSWADSQWCA